MISFSGAVREELMRYYSKKESMQKAEAAAIGIFNGRFLSYDEENKRYIYENSRAGTDANFTSARKTYNISKVADWETAVRRLTKYPEEKRAFLRGAFIASGSISDPKREYHFEIAAPSDGYAEMIIDMLDTFDIRAKVNRSRGRHSVYIKSAEDISLTLNVIGADSSMMEFENIKIERELRGETNRRVNCDTANINKSVNAGARQIADIELIRDTIGLDELDEPLRRMCMARLENPDASITELGELMCPPIGKSGARHRLDRINAIAERIRSTKEGTRSAKG